ncbi:DMT family transporter [Arenimonas sp.]|uniref:DMT family transporter n=1 Tax=Arenimonas sp. TaxID=1872635 RepID=UPI0039E51DA8
MNRRQPLNGIAAMLLAVALFSVMDTGLKLLSTHYPALQVAALRAMSSLPLVCAFVLWRGAVRSLFRVRWSLHLLRGVLGIGMLALFAYGLRHLPLAEAYSIFFVAPLVITVLSVPMLGERVSKGRWWAVAVGLLGVLVVLRPTGEGIFTLSGLAILVAAVCYSVSAITVRIVVRTDSVESQLFWLMTMVALGAGAMAAPQWVAIRLDDAWILLVVAITGFLGQLAITQAFRFGEASAIAPFEYTALAWGLLIDWSLWNTLPDAWMLAGAGIIVASGVYLVRHETVHAECEHP